MKIQTALATLLAASTGPSLATACPFSTGVQQMHAHVELEASKDLSEWVSFEDTEIFSETDLVARLKDNSVVSLSEVSISEPDGNGRRTEICVYIGGAWYVCFDFNGTCNALTHCSETKLRNMQIPGTHQ